MIGIARQDADDVPEWLCERHDDGLRGPREQPRGPKFSFEGPKTSQP